MKIVVGHKNLNLEELFNVSCLPSQSEVVVDNQLVAELNPQGAPVPQQKELQVYPEIPAKLALSHDHERAILLIKLIQLLKLKKNASKKTVEFLVEALNGNTSFVTDTSNQIFKHLFELALSKDIFFTEKELFIFQNTVHVYQAVFGLEIYKLAQQMKLIDTTLAFTLETLNVHVDYLTEYALTLGKSTHGVNNFKNNLQALTDKSKMLNQQQPNKALQDQLKLSRVYQLQASLHERLLQLSQFVANETNAEFGSLFQEKKYKELIIIGKEHQEEQLRVFAQQVKTLDYICKELCALSMGRTAILKGQGKQDQIQEESKVTEDIHETFNTLKTNSLVNSYLEELFTDYTKSKTQENELKAKASGKDDGKDQKKKKQAVTSLQFGTGTRKFFDYLLIIAIDQDKEFYNKMNVLFNKELDSVMNELLESRNEERRRPKCPKGTRDMTAKQMAIREKAFNIIKSIFKKHGACEIDTPVFELKETLMGKYGEESKLIYDLEDQGGELLSLRYDLTVPFARYVALNNLPSIKRFHIAKVYRRDNPQMNKGRFREFYQCDFDIAGSYNLMIPDAEVVKVVTEILSQLNIGKFVIKINHRKFLDAMVELSGCEKRKFKAICSSVDKLDKEPWEKVKEELIMMKGLTEEMTNKLEKFVKLVGKPRELLQKLKDEGIFAGHKEGEETIKEMETLFDYLSAMDCLDYLQFDFSLARGLDYYTGLIYEAVLTDQNKVGSIAGGGRYDGLVGMFSGKQIPAVGVSIGIERVFSILEEQAESKHDGSVRATETQVLVGQIGKNLLTERLQVLNELWSIGIKAETIYQDNPKMQRQFDFALENWIPLIVWVAEDELKNGLLKIKSLNKEEQYDIKRVELKEKIFEILNDGNLVLLPPELRAQQKSDAGIKEESKAKE